MSTAYLMPLRRLILAGLALGLLGTLRLAVPAPAQPRAPLPRFTEEREAAALFFVKKHLPELMPLLDELKKSQPRRYEQEVSRIFQATELLADLRDDPERHDLELKIWKTENKANLVIARMNVLSEAERKQTEVQLRNLADELVELEIQVLQQRAAQLKKELGKADQDLQKTRNNKDKLVRDRFESFLEKTKKAGK